MTFKNKTDVQVIWDDIWREGMVVNYNQSAEIYTIELANLRDSIKISKGNYLKRYIYVNNYY